MDTTYSVKVEIHPPEEDPYRPKRVSREKWISTLNSASDEIKRRLQRELAQKNDEIQRMRDAYELALQQKREEYETTKDELTEKEREFQQEREEVEKMQDTYKRSTQQEQEQRNEETKKQLENTKREMEGVRKKWENKKRGMEGVRSGPTFTKRQKTTKRKRTSKSEDDDSNEGRHEHPEEMQTFVNLVYEMHMSKYLRGEVSWQTYLEEKLIKLRQQVIKNRKWLQLYFINWTFVSTLIREQGKNLVGYLLYKAPQSIVNTFCDVWADMTPEAQSYDPEEEAAAINYVYLKIEDDKDTPVLQRLYPYTLPQSFTFLTSGLYVWLSLHGAEDFSSHLEVSPADGLGFIDTYHGSFNIPSREEVQKLKGKREDWIEKKSRESSLQKRIHGLVKATKSYGKAPITGELLRKANEDSTTAAPSEISSPWKMMASTLTQNLEEMKPPKAKRDGKNVSSSTAGNADKTKSEKCLADAQELLQKIQGSDEARETSPQEYRDDSSYKTRYPVLFKSTPLPPVELRRELGHSTQSRTTRGNFGLPGAYSSVKEEGGNPQDAAASAFPEVEIESHSQKVFQEKRNYGDGDENQRGSRPSQKRGFTRKLFK